MDVNLKLNGKSLLAVIAISSGLIFANFVSVVDAESNGGVTVIQPEESAPVGTVALWTTATPPTGWIEMNGQSTAGYSELAAIVGSNVPDLRGQFVRAWDNNAGIDSSRALLSSQGDAIRNITGSYTTYYAANGSGAFYTPNSTNNKSSLANGSGYKVSNITFDASRTVPTANENRPTNIALMYIIRAE